MQIIIRPFEDTIGLFNEIKRESMKFTISRELLLKPLQLVAGVVERRQTLPVLSNVLIKLTDRQLTMTGTDLEVEIVGQVQLEETGESGEITVPARKLLDICKALPEDVTVSFSLEGEKAVVAAARSRFTLSTLPANEFPNVEEGDASLRFVVVQQQLKDLINATSFAMAQQDVRYYLNGMLLEVEKGKLTAVATDGHRLALSSMDAADIDVQEKVQVVLPRKGVVELSRLLSDTGDITVTLGANHLRVMADDFSFTSKLVDGAYPDYQRVLPKGGTNHLTASKELLRHAFSRTAILSNEKYRGVRLGLTEGLLVLSANNPEQEEAQEEVVVEYGGDTLEIGFNVNYVLDVLGALQGDNVRITLSDANSSALIEDPADGANALYVVMPMRL